jgi:adenylate kinase family enzyme
LRVHLTGGPGGGKTTAGRRVADALGAPFIDLDGLALEFERQFGDFTTAFEALAREVPVIAAGETWVSEGAYLGWAEPLLQAADTVVWLDTPAAVCLYRVAARHVKAEIARDNRFPGWRRFARFWYWCLRYYVNRNPASLNQYGTPETRAYTAQCLQEYAAKLVVCRSKADIERVTREWLA